MVANVLGATLERERHETALREGELRWRAVLDAAPNAIVIADREGRVAFTNPQVERLFGYTPQELVGQPVEMLVPDARGAARGSPQGYFHDPATRSMGARPRSVGAAEGRHRVLRRDQSSSSFQMAGETFAVAFVHDITERLRLEAQFRQAQKMEAVGRLAGGIAHDFNNLLTAILGYAGLVLDHAAVRRSASAATSSRSASAADRAARLTRQLLAFSRQQVLRPRSST